MKRYELHTYDRTTLGMIYPKADTMDEVRALVREIDTHAHETIDGYVNAVFDNERDCFVDTDDWSHGARHGSLSDAITNADELGDAIHQALESAVYADERFGTVIQHDESTLRVTLADGAVYKLTITQMVAHP